VTGEHLTVRARAWLLRAACRHHHTPLPTHHRTCHTHHTTAPLRAQRRGNLCARRQAVTAGAMDLPPRCLPLRYPPRGAGGGRTAMPACPSCLSSSDGRTWAAQPQFSDIAACCVTDAPPPLRARRLPVPAWLACALSPPQHRLQRHPPGPRQQPRARTVALLVGRAARTPAAAAALHYAARVRLHCACNSLLLPTPPPSLACHLRKAAYRRWYAALTAIVLARVPTMRISLTLSWPSLLYTVLHTPVAGRGSKRTEGCWRRSCRGSSLSFLPGCRFTHYGKIGCGRDAFWVIAPR